MYGLGRPFYQKAVDSADDLRYPLPMTDEPRDLAVENALLRSCLWMVARRLKDYQDAPAFEIEDDEGPALEVIIPASLREKAAEALEKDRQGQFTEDLVEKDRQGQFTEDLA